MKIILEYIQLINESSGIELNQLKSDLRETDTDQYILRLSYNEDKTLCSFSFMQTTDHASSFSDKETADNFSMTIKDELRKALEKLKKIDSRYESLATQILVNAEPSSKRSSDSSDSSVKYSPVIISKFDRYLKIGDKEND